MKAKLTLLLSLAVLLIAPVALHAQTHRATVRGTITDPNKAVIPGATVKLVNTETNELRETTSGAEGEYTISSLPPGAYRLEAEAQGFLKYSAPIVLQVNQQLRADASLVIPGPETDQQMIVDSPNELKKDSASISAVIENRQVTGLPLDGRNFLELSLLVPGAYPAAEGSAASVRGDFAFNVNGAREDANYFLLDGVYNVDPKLNTFGVRPPVDAVREFEILTNSYDASFGRNAGAQVNVVLKSGTNDVRGTLYEFHRNGKFDARNYFVPADQPDPKYIRNQFGFSLGGPIVKDRTFLFGDYEGTRTRAGVTRVSNVPTLLERNGDFSQSFGFTGQPIQVINPLTGQPFAGGRIPAEFQSPIGRAIANLYPLPNRNAPFQNFVSSPTSRDRNDHFDVRLDHRLTERGQLAARYSFGDRDFFDPFTGPTFALVPGFGVFVPRRSQNAMLSETHVFSPAFVNEARFAFNRVASRVIPEGRGQSLNRQVGLPELSSNPRDFGLSFITIPGFSPLGDEFNNPQQSVTNTFQFIEAATYSRGAHLFKFGFDFRHVQQNAFRDVQSRGFLTFTGFTGAPLADLLLGAPSFTGGARVDNYQHLRGESYNLFFNDGYRVTPRLTITYGLRYEYNSPPVDTEDRANVFDSATGSLVPVGTRGIPRAGYEDDRNNFAPRVGVAWTLDAEGRTVLRGGYGVYYDQNALAPGEALFFNAPFFDLRFFFPLQGLPLTLNDPFPTNFPFRLPSTAVGFQRDLRTPYMQHWNLSVQRELGRGRVVEVAYVGSKGTKLLNARDFNQPRPTAAQPNPRPLPQFDDVNLLESRANSTYHSLQTRLQQRLSRGLSLLASYTYAKSIDDASNFFTSTGDPNFPQDSLNVRAERGRSNFDVRHRFSASYAYDLPFGRGQRFLDDEGFLTTLLTGWQTYGVVTLQTGRPFTVALRSDIDQSNTGRSNLGFGANDRPNVVGDPHLSNRTPERWFNPAAFALPAFGTFGNAGRNTLDGPGFQNVNASLVKNTALTETINLQLRFETFNLFNRPNFDLPDNFLGSPTFGRILSARDPRHLQFGAKLVF
ncbi:MAG: carboxypeptidase regulatory-like domain-containing protein [Pyrinomonadaceae bacterium]